MPAPRCSMFTGWMLFLMPNQQCRCTESNEFLWKSMLLVLSFHFIPSSLHLDLWCAASNAFICTAVSSHSSSLCRLAKLLAIHIVSLIQVDAQSTVWKNKCSQKFDIRPHRWITRMVQSCSSGCANVHPYLIHSSLDSPDSASQTAYQSVQPFLHSWWQRVPIYNGPHLPSKMPLPMGVLDPHLYMVPWAQRVQIPNDISIVSAVFVWLMTGTDQQTRDHATPYVAIGRIYIVLWSGLTMKKNNEKEGTKINNCAEHKVSNFWSNDGPQESLTMQRPRNVLTPHTE